jgi:hypothetical protein
MARKGERMGRRKKSRKGKGTEKGTERAQPFLLLPCCESVIEFEMIMRVLDSRTGKDEKIDSLTVKNSEFSGKHIEITLETSLISKSYQGQKRRNLGQKYEPDSKFTSEDQFHSHGY